MEYILGAGNYSVEGHTAVTLGKFDGLHKGHQVLVQKICEYKEAGCKSVIFTLNSEEKGQILTHYERASLAEELGADILIDCPLIPKITGMDPEEFVREILVRQLKARYIVVGTDFRFGYKRQGDVQLLSKLQSKYGFHVDIVNKQQYYGRDISSTYVREELSLGHVENVNELLGYSFYVFGEVLHEKFLTESLNLATTNLIASTKKLLPPNGVYITRTLIPDKVLHGLTKIGTHAVYKKHFHGIETYFFDFDEDLFGENIKVQFLHFLRPEIAFHSNTALKEQLYKDMVSGKEYFGE